jgi:membrane-associated phospholipid phosphatase
MLYLPKLISLPLDSVLGALALVAVPAAYLLIKKYKKEGIFVVFSGFSYFYSLLLKQYFGLPRPEAADPTVVFPQDAYGFPSSHVVFYTAFFGFILFLCFKLEGVSQKLRAGVGILSVLMISLVGWSRVALGHHGSADTNAGYVFGTIYLVVTILLYQVLKTNKLRLGKQRLSKLQLTKTQKTKNRISKNKK